MTNVYNVDKASAALLVFNYTTYNPVTVSYRVNDGAWQAEPWPFGACYTQNAFVLCGAKTIGVPVPLGDVRAGTNTIQFRTNDATAIANVDLVLVGAGGVPKPPMRRHHYPPNPFQ